jgi:translation initiation factor 1
MREDDFNASLVYSTSGDVPRARPVDAKRRLAPENGEKLRVSYETKGRKGKGMTLISGLRMEEPGLLDLAKKLKRTFGTGGSVKEGVIELQGDFREQAGRELVKLGILR